MLSPQEVDSAVCKLCLSADSRHLAVATRGRAGLLIVRLGGFGGGIDGGGGAADGGGGAGAGADKVVASCTKHQAGRVTTLCWLHSLPKQWSKHVCSRADLT